MITEITPYFTDAFGKIRSFARGKDETDGKVSRKFDSLSSNWVGTITGVFDQDISSLWVGAKGSGKSSAVLSVCYECAKKIADWRNDGSTWEEYYNLHELTACILEEDATRLMNVQRKYVVKNYDDIGIGWNARDWQDSDNQDKNDVFQINRTDQAIQCFSVPNQFLIDKVPRSLVNYYIEMDMQIFERGYTTIKVFKPTTMFREGKIINPFLQVNRNKFVNYLIPSPPHDLWSEYKKLRAKNKDIAIKNRMDSKVKKTEQKEKEKLLKEIKLQKQAERLLGVKPVTNKLEEKKKAEQEKWTDLFNKYQSEFVLMKQDRPELKIEKILGKIGVLHGVDGRGVAFWRSSGLIEKCGLDRL